MKELQTPDVVFKEFYQLKQEKNEKVQVFSVRFQGSSKQVNSEIS